MKHDGGVVGVVGGGASAEAESNDDVVVVVGGHRQAASSSSASTELTLTGASLASDGGVGVGGGGAAGGGGGVVVVRPRGGGAAGGRGRGGGGGGRGCRHHRSRSHSHSHGFHRGGDGGPPSPSPASVEERLERLLSSPSPTVRAALEACVKVGVYDSFEKICDAALERQRRGGGSLEGGKGGGGGGGGGEVGIVDLLGGYGPDGHTLAHWAAKRADDPRFLEYLAKLRDPNDRGTMTSSSRRVVVVVDLHRPSLDSVGMLPIHWAATEGSIPIVATLLRERRGGRSSSSVSTPSPSPSPTTADGPPNGADADDGDDGGGRATTAATASSASDAVATSHRPPAPFADDPVVDARDKSGCTPLLIAAQYGHADLAAFLIKRGADVLAVDDSRDAALHWASYKGSVPVCGLLLHLRGTEEHLDVPDAFGQTPLHLAALRGNLEVVRYLMDEAESYSDRTERRNGFRRWTGFRRHGRSNATSASVPGGGSGGNGPLRYPGYLLTLTDRDGKTPLDLAVKKKKSSCEAALREYADRHCRDVASPRSSFERARKTAANLLSPRSWSTWMGIDSSQGEDVSRRSPKFPYFLTITNMFVAFLFYPMAFLPVFRGWSGVGGAGNDGFLWDKAGLHMFTLSSMAVMWTSFVAIGRTDPGTLGNDYDGGGESTTSSSNGVVGVAVPPAEAARHRRARRRCCARASSTGGFVALPGLGRRRTTAGGGGGGGGRRGGFGNDGGRGGTTRIRDELRRATEGLRREYEETLESYSRSEPSTTTTTSTSSSSENDKSGDAVGVGGGRDATTTTKKSLCHTCHIAKPLRSKHCRISRRCVLVFDHHCPFVGSTIGLYNYPYFYLFLLSFVSSEIGFVTTWIYYLVRSPSFPWMPGLLGLYVGLFSLPGIAMLVYHTQLVARNLTTNEHQNLFRYGYLRDGSTGRYANPFDRGLATNVSDRLCSPGEGSYDLSVVADRDASPGRTGGPSALEMPGRGGGGTAAGGDERRDLLRNVV